MPGFRSSRTLVLFLFVCFCGSGLAAAADIPTPEQFFGHQMGAEGKIIDYLRSLEYYRLMADSSDRLLYREVGKTTDGNPFVILTISSPANLARLDEIRATRNRLADPRAIDDAEAGRIAAAMPAVVFHTSSIHSSEISTSQVPPEVIHRLVTGSDDEVRYLLDNLIILYSPSANPDGQVKYNRWYAEHVGKPWEGNLPEQYHTYVGHDNNRDWIMLELAESRHTVENVFLAWHPVYSHEMHEMGATSARIFVPPYEDPPDANAAPEIIATTNSLGMAISHRLTTEGKGGVVVNALFDLYSPSRAFQAYHGTARILTETASGNFARTRVITADQMARPEYGSEGGFNPLRQSWNFPLPWKPGPWTFRDRVEYQVSANFALMKQAATHRTQFNLATYHALKRAAGGENWPWAWVFPAGQRDPGAATRLLRLLQYGGLEIHQAGMEFTAGGVTYPAGSHVIILRQPYAAWAKTLLETQVYPDLRVSADDAPVMPYDVTGHTLPLLMGVQAVAVAEEFTADLRRVTETIAPTATIPAPGCAGYAMVPSETDVYAVADDLLDAGVAVRRLQKSFTDGVVTLPAGSFIIPASAREALQRVSAGRAFRAHALGAAPPAGSLASMRDPRIGIYEPWGGLMDAGWTRLLLERYNFEFTTLRNADLRAGNLEKSWDLIIVPNGVSSRNLVSGGRPMPEPYDGGIGSEGVAALRRFVEAGGTVVSWGGSAATLTTVFNLPLRNVVEGIDSRHYFAPGSIVLIETDPADPLNYGMPEKAPAQVRFGPVFAPSATTDCGPQFAARYPTYDPRLSGFLLGPEYLQGQGALAAQQVGEGRFILFSYLPQFRLMSHGTYRQVFNAIFLASQE